MKLKLGVNIDHVATLRQARGGAEPDPVKAAVLCQSAGAYCVTFHLREDRRHIQDKDALNLRKAITAKLNMEMANTSSMIKIAKKLKPDQITLVPEKREELTTEGGLDMKKSERKIAQTVKEFKKCGIDVSLFVDPDEEQVRIAARTGAGSVELHTGGYANAKDAKALKTELSKIRIAAMYAHELRLKVYAGHGLDYENIKGLLEIPYLLEVNIGHSIISRAVFSGIENAVKDMLELL